MPLSRRGGLAAPWGWVDGSGGGSPGWVGGRAGPCQAGLSQNPIQEQGSREGTGGSPSTRHLPGDGLRLGRDLSPG